MFGSIQQNLRGKRFNLGFFLVNFGPWKQLSFGLIIGL